MTQGIGSGESAEVRRALERLQNTLDIMGDRYRDIRRERRQLRERIEQLEREREAASMSLSARLETAAHDRKRAIEFEERAIQAEKGQADLHQRLVDLERQLAEREAMIAEQSDTIERQRERLDENRRREEESWTQEERFREEIQALTEQLARGQAERDRLGQQIRELEELRNAPPAAADEETLELTRQLAGMRERLGVLDGERADLIDAQAELQHRLDDALRDVAIARGLTGELESEIESLRTQLSHAGAARDGEVAEAARAAAELDQLRRTIAAREEELQGLHEAIKRMHIEALQESARLQGAIAELQTERERVLKTLVSVEGDRDSARATVESLLVRLKQLEASDDERLTAQRTRIDELTRDLSEALDMAAKKETDAMLAQTEVERLQRQIAELTERRDQLEGELEKLREAGTNAPAGTSNGIDDGEREVIVGRLREAIMLIDKHLGEV